MFATTNIRLPPLLFSCNHRYRIETFDCMRLCFICVILKWIQFSIIDDLLTLKEQNQLNKIISQIKTTFTAYLTSMKLKNHLFQRIRELDEIFGSGVQPLKRYTFYVVAPTLCVYP